MFGTWVIFRREVLSYFSSIVPYILAFAFLVLTGLAFNDDLVFSVTLKPVNPAVIPDVLAPALVFIAPILTMRTVAEERREGTMELLLTAPVSDAAIVFGKFFGAWFYFTLLLAITLIYQAVLSVITSPEFGVTASSYIGIWLYGGAALAVGVMYSSTTENQIIAAFLSTATLLVLYLGDTIGQIVPNINLALIIRELSLQGHYSTSFSIGLVRAEDVVFYAGVMILALFISIRAVEAQRWS